MLQCHKSTTTIKELYPSVFVLSDQSFPAAVPTGGEGERLKILQLEAAVTNLQREVLAKGDEAKALQKQIQLLSDADRDLVRVGPLCCDLCPSLGPPTCN